MAKTAQTIVTILAAGATVRHTKLEQVRYADI